MDDTNTPLKPLLVPCRPDAIAVKRSPPRGCAGAFWKKSLRR